jgi:D-alanyl-D-alanine carboxypeptidase
MMDSDEIFRGGVAALLTTAAMVPLLLATGHGPLASVANEPPAPKPPEAFDLAAVDAYIEGQVKAEGFVGLSVAVARGGVIVLAKGYGLASREKRTPADADTAFAIASVTKQFTCATAFLLEEDGKLSMDDKVSKYFPDLQRAADITLDDLGGHVAGYPDYYPLDFLDERSRHPIAPDDLLRRYATGKLDFEPRSRWSYSNTGFILLARAIEKASGQPLGDLLATRIFGPVGMAHASYDPKAGSLGLAQGYEAFAMSDPEPAEREATGWMGGAGAIYASAQDLAKWDIALMDGKVVRPESFRKMTTPHVLADGHSTGYGCGLSVAQLDNETILQHSGEANGFLAINVMVPRTHDAVVVLSNDQDKDPRALARVVTKLLIKQAEAPIPKVAGPPALDVARGLLKEMQTGSLDRSKLGEDFNAYVREDWARSAATRLGALGEPTGSDLDGLHERGGMEVSVVHFTFRTTKMRALMFRSVDGKVQEFLLTKD